MRGLHRGEEMRAGQHLVMRSAQPPPLPSLLPPSKGLFFTRYYTPFSPSAHYTTPRQISLFSSAATNCKFPPSIPSPFLAGCRLWNLCSPRAYHASDSSASIEPNIMLSMQNKIKEKLDAIVVTVKDAHGDGQHVSIDVVSAAFEGQSAVNRQRMVYKAIWEELETKVHAVDHMTTRTPSEAAENL